MWPYLNLRGSSWRRLMLGLAPEMVKWSKVGKWTTSPTHICIHLQSTMYCIHLQCTVYIYNVLYTSPMYCIHLQCCDLKPLWLFSTFSTYQEYLETCPAEAEARDYRSSSRGRYQHYCWLTRSSVYTGTSRYCWYNSLEGRGAKLASISIN